MDNNERIIKIEELKKLKEEVIKEAKENIDNEEATNRENTSSKIKKIGTGSITNGLNMYPEFEEKKAGMINIITLSFLSFIFEILFIFLSIIIFK